MKDLRKGFIFFIDQEKKEIKKLMAMSKAKQQNEEEKTGVPAIEQPLEWWDEDFELCRPINEWTLQRNEWLDIGMEASQVPPYVPVKISFSNPEEALAMLQSDETDEEFDWFDPEEHTEGTYFNFVNKNRETIQTGDQLFYCYGNRTNKFLLLNYGFCFPGNKYDSYEFPLRLDVPVDDLFVPEIVDLNWSSARTQSVRLKKDQINEVMIAFLRSICKKGFFARQTKQDLLTGVKTHFSRRILLTRPSILTYELYVFDYYLKVCTFLQDQFARVATLEQDLELLNRGEPGHPGQPIDFEFRMAVVYRAEKKKILRSQIILVEKVINVLRNCEEALEGCGDAGTSEEF